MDVRSVPPPARRVNGDRKGGAEVETYSDRTRQVFGTSSARALRALLTYPEQPLVETDAPVPFAAPTLSA